MKKWKVWGSTLVHVVKVVEAESAESAILALDASVVVTGDAVRPVSTTGLLEVLIDDEWVPCEVDDVIEVTRGPSPFRRSSR